MNTAPTARYRAVVPELYQQHTFPQRESDPFPIHLPPSPPSTAKLVFGDKGKFLTKTSAHSRCMQQERQVKRATSTPVAAFSFRSNLTSKADC